MEPLNGGAAAIQSAGSSWGVALVRNSLPDALIRKVADKFFPEDLALSHSVAMGDRGFRQPKPCMVKEIVALPGLGMDVLTTMELPWGVGFPITSDE